MQEIQRRQLQQAEQAVWDFNFESSDHHTLAALIGCRNQLFEDVERVPSRIREIQEALKPHQT
jgi:hypothetical protein